METDRAFAQGCPTPATAATKARVVVELEAAIKAGVPPDALAADWERLDAGARACRERR